MPSTTSVGPSEIIALGVVVLAALTVAARRLQSTRIRLLFLCGFLVAATVSAATLRPSLRVRPAPARSTPKPNTSLEYVTSTACLGCHPGEHASFSRTYHRTMTQVATPSSVLAPMVDGNGSGRLQNKNGEVWASLPDPDPDPDSSSVDIARDVSRRVVITTGSHREQAYWVAGRREGDLRLAPFVWLVREKTFVERRDAFLLPPDAPMPKVRWASSCIACHAVAGEPRHDLEKDAFDTRAAELGIACEACHGPGGAHVARLRDPVERYTRATPSKTAAHDIINPKHLSPDRSAAVCGQCHAYAFPRDVNGWWTEGYSRTFRAGDALEPSRTIFSPANVGASTAPVMDAAADAIFWPDGSVRVGGREYNGLIESPCYTRGGEGDRKMTCLSCHSMHKSDPSGQIAVDREGDRGCTSCHQDEKAKTHSHHAAGSAGSACVSCHMPKTSYALLSAVRSHRIDSPRASDTAAASGEKPNACNLCHLDRSLAWTAQTLHDWYGAATTTTTTTTTMMRDDTPFALRVGLAADAGARALIADALGSDDATRAMKDSALRVSVLLQMKKDPYAAVRFIAERSLRGLPRDCQTTTTASKSVDDFALSLIMERDQRSITIAE